ARLPACVQNFTHRSLLRQCAGKTNYHWDKITTFTKLYETFMARRAVLGPKSCPATPDGIFYGSKNFSGIFLTQVEQRSLSNND
ncbi:MAG: hypothetical protein RMJ19_09700, partial [Gemmatales bacterium]|nr:hypothetical protein [Gemmatales bacterium]MDW8175933.1 hypothetical protein [Gemmatales bacterium]